MQKLLAYFLMKQSDFGQGLWPNGIDSARSLYDRLVELDEGSVMASRKKLRLAYEVLTFHTSLCTEKCVPYSTLGARVRHHRSDAAGPHTSPLTVPRTTVFARIPMVLEPPAEHGCTAVQVRHVGLGALAAGDRRGPCARALASDHASAARIVPTVSASAFAGMPLPRMPLPACSAANLVPCAPISCGYRE